MEPTVSVIIPVYNGQRTIEACVRSFLAQTYPHLELILVDDGSADKTAEIIGNLAKEENRIKVLRKENGGPSSARNLGLANAGGKYICFADSDDAVDRRFVECLLSDIRKAGCDLAVCGYRIRKPDGGITAAEPIGSGAVTAAYLKRNMFLPQDRGWGGFVWNKLYQTDIIREHSVTFPEECRMFEDMVFNYRYLAHCGKVCLNREALYCYQLRRDSLTKQVDLQPHTLEKWLHYPEAFDRVLDMETDENVLGILRCQKLLHTSTAVRALHGVGYGNHPQCGEYRRFLRKNLGRFVLCGTIPVKKRVGAVLTALMPRVAFRLWQKGA